MGKKVFISYSHQQEEWVLQRLKPCLDAGGAEVLIDAERFRAGRTLVAEENGAWRLRVPLMVRWLKARG